MDNRGIFVIGIFDNQTLYLQRHLSDVCFHSRIERQKMRNEIPLAFRFTEPDFRNYSSRST